MKATKKCFLRSSTTMVSVSFLLLFFTSCIYMKMDPPADVDKALPITNDNSCYLATAANMLAGAGYGTGASLQARANDIYADLTAEFGIADGGWTDTAISWWLTSAHNTWASNPYDVVTVFGNKDPKYPWANSAGPKDFGNSLRSCNFVGLSISWPTNQVIGGVPVIGSGGHAITDWGDNRSKGTLTSNPTQARIADSDRDTGGDVQAYTYDSYTSPNPGGANEGNGWYFNYDPNHPYIKHIIVLSPTTNAAGNVLTQKVIGSYKIHQNSRMPATDLHYEVGTDVEILTYKTEINWQTSTPPTIAEETPTRKWLTVDWDLTANPIPYCSWVTITTEFILPYWNAISYRKVHFTYPKIPDVVYPPDLAWEVKTPRIDKAASIPNVTGGYLIGSFEVINPDLPPERRIIGEYRFVHEYSFDQNPESHLFRVSGMKGFAITNIRFGHSYGYLHAQNLWVFKDWMTDLGDKSLALKEEAAEIKIDWKGRLPYPEGENIKKRIPDIKKGLLRVVN